MGANLTALQTQALLEIERFLVAHPQYKERGFSFEVPGGWRNVDTGVAFNAATLQALIRKGVLTVTAERETVPQVQKRNPFTREWSFTKPRTIVTVKLEV